MLCHPSTSGQEDRVAWANLQFSTFECMALPFLTIITTTQKHDTNLEAS